MAASHPDLAPGPEWAARVHPGYQYIAVSELRRRQWRDLTSCESAVIPNGLDPARVLGLPPNVAALADAYSLLDGRILLLHPTRLLRRKNVEFSLATVAELARQGHSATLLITGAADPHTGSDATHYAAWLREEKSRLGADAHFLADYFEVGDAELAALYRLADGLLFPSRQEGFGLPVLEAALHRLPIFCADREPLRDLALPHGHLLPADCTPASAATLIATRLLQDGAFLSRRRTLTEYAWPRIYARHLGPLLGEREENPSRLR
jgi:glycosyltransferase involved in cell wall biosynthesis